AGCRRSTSRRAATRRSSTTAAASPRWRATPASKFASTSSRGSSTPSRWPPDAPPRPTTRSASRPNGYGRSSAWHAPRARRQPPDGGSARPPVRLDMTTRTTGRDLAPDWRALQSAIAGGVILPEAPEYASVCTPPVARFDDGFLVAAGAARPAAVVLCKEPADVAATVAFARRFGLETASRSGGHCFARRSYTNGLVIDVSPMRSVSASGAVATVGAGTRLGELYHSLETEQLTIAAAYGPSVGIAGVTLGGGVGILGRLHGLTCDQLLGAQIVLADGRIV